MCWLQIDRKLRKHLLFQHATAYVVLGWGPIPSHGITQSFFCRDCSIVCKLGKSHLTLQSVSAAFWMDGENKKWWFETRPFSFYRGKYINWFLFFPFLSLSSEVAAKKRKCNQTFFPSQIWKLNQSRVNNARVESDKWFLPAQLGNMYSNPLWRYIKKTTIFQSINKFEYHSLLNSLLLMLLAYDMQKKPFPNMLWGQSGEKSFILFKVDRIFSRNASNIDRLHF